MLSRSDFFKRYELKFLINKEQKDRLMHTILNYMKLDKYGRSKIINLYFDTDNYRLIRASIEKPVYKEKLRIRSYGKATPDSTVFVELKKKYNHIVYKRRVEMKHDEAIDWVISGKIPLNYTQIHREIDYFLSFYKELKPLTYLSYEREAYYTVEPSDFRVTFDDNIIFRQNDVSLTSDIYGKHIINNDAILMEIKCSGAIPLWFVEQLSKEKIYKTSFSKYGTAYRNYILPYLNSKENPIIKEQMVYE